MVFTAHVVEKLKRVACALESWISAEPSGGRPSCKMRLLMDKKKTRKRSGAFAQAQV
jgi:hypothetical protein